MKRLSILLIALPLCGCFAAQKQQLAECSMESQRIYPNPSEAPPEQPWLFEKTCMEAAGYALLIQQKQCSADMYTLRHENDPYCYVPTNPLARWLYDNEMAKATSSN